MYFQCQHIISVHSLKIPNGNLIFSEISHKKALILHTYNYLTELPHIIHLSKKQWLSEYYLYKTSVFYL